jgi:hypothetical protein
MAWCARERGDQATERRWLTEALAAYRAAYEEADLGSGKAELRVQYLCGELALRLGDQATAIDWFARALRHPELKEFPVWERMLRDQWAMARETDASARLAASAIVLTAPAA